MGVFAIPMIGAKLRGVMSALFSCRDSSDLVIASHFSGHYHRARSANAVLTGTNAQAEVPIWQNDTGVAMQIAAIVINPTTALTANDTDYATLVLKYNVAGGTFGSGTSVLAATTQTTGTGGTGSWVVQTDVNLLAFAAAAAAALVIPAGATLSYSITKTGASGVTVPIGLLTVVMQPV